MRQKEKGFTLLELLVAAFLLGIAAITALSLFSKGIDVWEEAKFRSPLEYNAVLFLEEMEKGIKNSADFSEIGFSGEAAVFTFPSYIKKYDQELALTQEKIGCVKYRFDGEKKSVYKYRAVYPDCLVESLFIPIKMLDFVETFSLEYASLNEENKISWAGAWQKEQGKPMAIKIILRINLGDKAGKTYDFEKVVYVPAA